MVDKFEAGHKGTALEKGKGCDPGEQAKRGTEPEGDDDGPDRH